MAKKKVNAARGEKSAAVREVLAAQPGASLKEIQETLTAQGIEVSDALINKLKGAQKSKRKRKSAKADDGLSKADAIRGKFDQLGRNARPRDVIAALKLEGIEVTSAQVSMLRNKSPKNGASKSHVTSPVSFDHLLAAKQLSDQLGGVEKARQALDSFASLVGA